MEPTIVGSLDVELPEKVSGWKMSNFKQQLFLLFVWLKIHYTYRIWPDKFLGS